MHYEEWEEDDGMYTAAFKKNYLLMDKYLSCIIDEDEEDDDEDDEEEKDENYENLKTVVDPQLQLQTPLTQLQEPVKSSLKRPREEVYTS